MANVLLANLPLFTGNADGVFVVMNNSNEDETFKVTRETLIDVSEVAYSELASKITGNELTAGQFYLITDYQTCYDQPNYEYVKSWNEAHSLKESAMSDRDNSIIKSGSTTADKIIGIVNTNYKEGNPTTIEYKGKTYNLIRFNYLFFKTVSFQTDRGEKSFKHKDVLILK